MSSATTEESAGGGDAELARLARTKLRSSFTIAPLGNIMGDVAGVLGENLLGLMGMFYPRTICRKANVVITELVTNVLENVADADSSLQFDLACDEYELDIRVTNRVTDEQYASVKNRIDEINTTDDLRGMLARTIRERRGKRLKGGLGLMRLTQENKFFLSASYTDGLLTVKALYRVKEAE